MQESTKQGFNPYLPSWEYVPDGEPYVFGNRVYVYGSHDRFNGHAYCLGDYISWSAPVDNLADWRYEGVIYRTEDVENNADRDSCLYAPDVAQGPDGRYYLYYVDSKRSIVSVAVSDSPAGRFTFYGYVVDKAGGILGARPGDEPQFDPGVLFEDGLVYLFTGFCPREDKSRTGAMVTVLEPDMRTIRSNPRTVIPSDSHSKGSSFEGHAYFEAPSIRKRGNLYYLIYSSVAMHELCYATSSYPDRDFTYRGVIVSNADMGIASYKPANKPMFYGANNHGSIVEIQGQWYIFYHRHTNGHQYSRQGCLEAIQFREDGSIPQVEMTSCGPNRGPLRGLGEYPAYLACNLFTTEESLYTDESSAWMDHQFPKITQEGGDFDPESGTQGPVGYLANMRDGACAGFKYFSCRAVRNIKIRVRGYCTGSFQVSTAWNGPALGTIPVHFSNSWQEYSATIPIPDGIQSLYFTYRGSGPAQLASFTLLP